MEMCASEQYGSANKISDIATGDAISETVNSAW